ncbi:hypothetical protein FRC17_000532 [Serendipita sp. 399]|nr:hypothetical protein FRC17_000532 [Serendipita sp. 399]
MSSSVPIYLTFKNPFPDLSTFDPTHFERARHLTIDAPNGAYQHQNFLALLRRGYFGNVQQVQYLQNGIPAACIANPSRVWLWGHHNHIWLVPESMQKVARISPIRAVNRFDFEIESARSHFLGSADIFFASVMNKYLHISALVVIADDLMELMKRFQEPHKLVFPYLQALVYKRRSFKGVIHPLDRRVKPVLFIFAPALEWVSVEDTFDSPTDGFRVLQLESSHPVGMNFTMRGPLRMDADISVLQSGCFHSVATLNLNLLRISAPLNPQQESDHSSVLKAIKKSLDGVIVQMPRLSFVKVLVRHNMVDLLEALLPLPRSITKRKIWWKIEISNGMQSRHLDPMNPPIGIDIDRLVLQARKLPWTKLPQTRALSVDSIVDVNIFLAAIYPPLNELKIGLQVQKLSKAQVLDNMVSLYGLTTLHSPVWFALKVLQSRSVPLLKRLILLIHDSDSKESYSKGRETPGGRLCARTAGRVQRGLPRNDPVSFLPNVDDPLQPHQLQVQ